MSSPILRKRTEHFPIAELGLLVPVLGPCIHLVYTVLLEAWLPVRASIGCSAHCESFGRAAHGSRLASLAPSPYCGLGAGFHLRWTQSSTSSRKNAYVILSLCECWCAWQEAGETVRQLEQHLQACSHHRFGCTERATGRRMAN